MSCGEGWLMCAKYHEPSLTYELAEIDGFPFFINDFSYEQHHNTMNLSSMTSTKSRTAKIETEIECSFIVEGAYSVEQVTNLALDSQCVPTTVDVEIMNIGGDPQYIFENALISVTRDALRDGTNVGRINVQATDVEKAAI